MTIYDCRTHVRMTSMTSSVDRTDLNFKISVALLPSFTQIMIKPFRHMLVNSLMAKLFLNTVLQRQPGRPKLCLTLYHRYIIWLILI